MSLLATALLLAVLALVLGSRRASGGGGRDPLGRAPLLATLLAYLFPALFLLGFLLFGMPPEAQRLRLALLGVGLRGAEGEALEATVGGDRDEHLLWVPGFSGNEQASLLAELHFQPGAGGGPGTVELAAAASTESLVATHPPGRAFQLPAALQLADGDQLRIADQRWQVRFESRLLGPRRELLVPAEGAAVAVPPRLGRLPLVRLAYPVRRPFSVAQRSHPIAFLARQGQPAYRGAPLASFLYRDPDTRGLWLAAVEPQVQLWRNGEQVTAPESETLGPGARLHVTALPLPVASFEAGGVRDRRSFRVLPGRRSLALAFDTPEIHTLSAAELAALLAPKAKAEDPPRVQLALGEWEVTDRFLHLRHASNLVASEAFATLELPAVLIQGAGRGYVLAQGLGLSTPSLAVISPFGQRQVPLGEPFWLGRRYLAAVQLDLLAPPLLLGLLGLGLAVAKALAAQTAGLSRGQVLFAAALELLVALRLLLGYRVWALPPFATEAYELALVAWMLLPWTLIVASLPPLRDPRPRLSELAPWLPALGGWALALAWCWQLSGGVQAWAWLLVLVAALAVPVGRSFLVSRWGAGLSYRLQRLLRSLRWPSRLPAALRSPRVVWTLAAFVPALLRLFLLLLGSRESLQLGGARFSLSLLHVPLALAIESGYLVWLWQRLAGSAGLQRADLLPGLAILAGTWALPAGLVSDFGLALLNLPVLLLALTTLAWAAARYLRPSRRQGWPLAMPAAALLVYLAVVAMPVAVRALVDVLPEGLQLRLASERNYLRVLAYAYEDELEGIGRRNSEEMAVMTSVLRAYTSGDEAWRGRGYLGSEVSPHIEATALREHAPAVFLAAEWGLAGTLGLLLLLLLLAARGLELLPWRSWYQDLLGRGDPATAFWATLGGLAALTLAVPSVYMVLANYGAVLFTGRNVYLFGLDSAADLLETALLALIFAAGSTVLREKA